MSILHVQDKTVTYATATTYTAAFNSGNTTGNLLIALAQWADNTSTPTIGPDTNGNTWNQIFFQNNTFGSQSWAAWYAIALPGANTVPVSISGSAVLGGVCLGEFSGIDTIDLNISQATGSGATLTSNSGASAHNDELLLGFMGTTGGNLTAAGAYTLGGQILFSAVPYIGIIWQIVSATNTYTADATGNSGTWAAQLSSFYSSATPASNNRISTFWLQ